MSIMYLARAAAPTQYKSQPVAHMAAVTAKTTLSKMLTPFPLRRGGFLCTELLPVLPLPPGLW